MQLTDTVPSSTPFTGIKDLLFVVYLLSGALYCGLNACCHTVERRFGVGVTFGLKSGQVSGWSCVHDRMIDVRSKTTKLIIVNQSSKYAQAYVQFLLILILIPPYVNLCRYVVLPKVDRADLKQSPCLRARIKG